jgi:putative membrane protein
MRRILLIAGLLTLAAAWLGPLPSLARTAFFAHMTMHMTVVAIAAPLVALGIASTAWDPVSKAPRLFVAIPASLLELILVWAWHAPALHHLARSNPVAMAAEQATFLVAGLLLWLSAFGRDSRSEYNRVGSGVVGLLLTSMHMTLLGALLALAPRPLYVHSHGFQALTPIEDQQLGGAIMLAAGGLSYLLGGLSLTARILQPSRREA